MKSILIYCNPSRVVLAEDVDENGHPPGFDIATEILSNGYWGVCPESGFKEMLNAPDYTGDDVETKWLRNVIKHLAIRKIELMGRVDESWKQYAP